MWIERRGEGIGKKAEVGDGTCSDSTTTTSTSFVSRAVSRAAYKAYSALTYLAQLITILCSYLWRLVLSLHYGLSIIHQYICANYLNNYPNNCTNTNSGEIKTLNKNNSSSKMTIEITSASLISSDIIEEEESGSIMDIPASITGLTGRTDLNINIKPLTKSLSSDDCSSNNSEDSDFIHNDSSEEGENDHLFLGSKSQNENELSDDAGYGDGSRSASLTSETSDKITKSSYELKERRRDSDTSDYISSDGGGSGSDCTPDICKKIVDQVESMFSDEHLVKDGFLLKHVRRRSDGFVSLKLVAGLRKVKQISREFNVILDALKKAQQVEVNEEGTKVRRIAPLSPYLKTLPTTTANNKENTASTGTGGKRDSLKGNDRNARRRGGSLPMVHQTSNGNYSSGSGGGSPPANSYGNGGGQWIQHARQTKSNSYSAGHPNNGFYTPSNGANSNNWGRKNSSPSLGGNNGGNNYHHHRGSFSGPANKDNKIPELLNNEDIINRAVVRRRGGSLPIAPRPSSGHYSSSPPSHGVHGPLESIPQRPKSNSYCEGSTTGATGTSAWLQKRLAAGRISDGNLSFSAGAIVRQPRGPDGTKGFQSGYRELILKEKSLQSHTFNQSAISA